MASINKLSIRGVRAFSPEDQEQVLEFYFPITIIVGQNGCGKTTIIESLKYAITGSFPPGCGRSGNAFVHDPRTIGQTTVKANVKLRFTSRSSQEMVVVRSMELTQKKTKATFKQLDGVLRMMDPTTGERVNLSHKCSELDKQIPQLLGVSKAILEHVVFCHQEDASWPLQEGAVLKKRFDDIFDSTKYSKALKIFRDTEKEYLSKVKDLKVDVASLGSHKHAAEGFRQELADQNEQITYIEEEKKGHSEEIDRIDRELEGLSEVIAKVDDINFEIDSCKNEICQEELVVQKQLSMVEEDLTKKHTMMELKDMIRDFHQSMSSQKNEMEDLQAQSDQIDLDIETLRQESTGLTSKTGQLTAEKEAHEKNLRDRYGLMEQIAQRYSMDLTQMSQSQANTSIIASLSQSMTLDDDEDTATYATITAEDMQGFSDALDAKAAELKSNLQAHKDRYQKEEDKITQVLTDLGGKLQAVENDKKRLSEEKNQAEREIRELKVASGPTRIRKNDVEDHRRRAKQAAEERDQQNDDPRRNQIQIQIRQIEESMDKIKRKVEDEIRLQNELRHTADSHNSMVNLKEQCGKELDGLDEYLREESYSLKKFGVDVPNGLPAEDDEDGDRLTKVVESISKTTREKFDSANANLSRTADDATNTQKIVSEKNALLAGSQRKLGTVKNQLQKLEGSVEDVKRVVDQLRRHETDLGEVLIADEDQPRELLNYLSERLEKVEEDAPTMFAPKVAKKILKRLSKMARVYKPGTKQVERVACPCCKRELNGDEEIQQFVGALEELQADSSPLVKSDPAATERYNSLKTTYQSMRKTVESKMDSLRDHRRLTDEVVDLEKEIKRLQDDVTHYTSSLKNQTDQKNDAQEEVTDLRELVDLARRWSDDATRIVEKKLQIKSMKRDLEHSVTDSSRDLKTVELSIAELRGEQEALSTKTQRLNKEMTDINHRITEMNTRATNLEKLASEKEAKYAQELKAIDRKKELTDRIQQIAEEEKQLADQVAPIHTKKRKKESEKQRTRSLAHDEEKKLQSIIGDFDGDKQTLDRFVRQINDYTSSTKAQELDGISSKIAKIEKRIQAKQGDLQELKPTLESVKRAVDDQERRKKQLQQNVDILEARERMDASKKEVEKLENKRDAIEGYDTASQKLAAASKRKEKLVEKRARADGIWKAHVEQIRALQRKLSQPEYNDVDEEYRVAMIKHATTKTAAEDLKKYGNALDKALLQFHGVKIQEINKIISELWMMTYKGEDITNIEIQSGQEPGSKASKSYNYRVVMSKGGSKMDMRGRCSAGQRVLTSIVIRLALAETFGVNCGCIALDEPTVNLDYTNKGGLAVALAHLVAARASQRNFQLLLITHDEEFVAMMKTELSSLTGFSMPEKYFQVCREEAPDGKYYSKINQLDWDQLL